MTPQTESTSARMRRFFDENHDEELTLADACIKFGMKPRSLSTLLWDMRKRGEIETVTVIRRPKGIE